MITTGEELRELREKMGWTQYYLADRLGTQRTNIAHWESGRAPVPIVVGRAISLAWKHFQKNVIKRLDISYDELTSEVVSFKRSYRKPL